ncbi:MAG: hypothetical protein CMQ20_13120 [Gammaproteobacteria bacterium]|nr:hypothetical protein [Gammaproteobacteria bacterium]
MKLIPLMTMEAELRQPADSIGAGPLGTRSVTEVMGGSFSGERLKGTVLRPGADWVLIGADGLIHVDVRITLKTDDGALIYMQYPGKLVLNDKFTEASQQGKDMQLGDTYFMTQPRFETGSDDYAWLNSIVAVAEGRVLGGATGVEYQVYECQHD